MIKIEKGWYYSLKIYASKVNAVDFFRLSQYSSYQGPIPFGMIPEFKNTNVIDLSQTKDELLNACKSNTRNEIRRAIREGFFYEKVNSIPEFVVFYNKFAKEKKLQALYEEDLKKFGKHLLLYKSGIRDKTLTMHASVIDYEKRSVFLLYSASIRFDETIDKKYVGFSNRYLHYQEFLEFKQLGALSYDFSGVCLKQDDPAKYQIGLFKQSFGGRNVKALKLYSVPMAIALFGSFLFHRLKLK